MRNSMSLYKAMKTEDAEYYLREDLLCVESEDSVCGMITFLERFAPNTIPQSNVMFEFEVASVDSLYKVDETPITHCRILELIRPNGAQVDSRWYHRIGDDFKLVAVTILRECKIDCKMIRMLLDEKGRHDVDIKNVDGKEVIVGSMQ